MQEMFLNWKTTLAGLASIATGFAHIFTAVSAGHVPDFSTDFGLLVTGIGLLFAKDGGVTGTSK